MNIEMLAPRVLLEHLEERREGKITQERLEEFCHYWAYQHAWKEMDFKPLPSEPIDYLQFKKMSRGQREHLPEDIRVSKQAMAMRYLEYKHNLMHINKTNYEYMKDLLKTFRKYNSNTMGNMVEERIKDYESKGVK